MNQEQAVEVFEHNLARRQAGKPITPEGHDSLIEALRVLPRLPQKTLETQELRDRWVIMDKGVKELTKPNPPVIKK